MSKTYKDSSLVIDRLERKFKQKVRAQSQRVIEEENFSPFLEYLYDDEGDDEESTSQTNTHQTRNSLIYRNY